jgi:hypothetical protein
MVIIPVPRVFGRENPQLVLVDYVRPQRGINNHVNPRGIRSKNTTPMSKFRHLLHYYAVNIVTFSPLFPCDLGVIIPIGCDGLCETSKRH